MLPKGDDPVYAKWSRPLTRCWLFAGVGAADLNIMLQCLNPVVKEYKKDECVTVAGETFSGVGVVLNGTVLVTKEDVAGRRVVLSVLGEGDLFGEMVAFSQEKNWPATVIAQQVCTVMFLPPEKIIGSCPHQCASHRLLIHNMLRIVSDKALRLNKQVMYLAMKSIREKVATLLLEEYRRAGTATFMLPLKRHELADFLNVARPSLSRELGRMKAEGIIDFHRSTVKILNLEKLKQMVE